MQKIYCEYSGGHWQAWTYSDGNQYYFRTLRTLQEIQNYCDKHHYKLVIVQ